MASTNIVIRYEFMMKNPKCLRKPNGREIREVHQVEILTTEPRVILLEDMNVGVVG